MPVVFCVVLDCVSIPISIKKHIFLLYDLHDEKTVSQEDVPCRMGSALIS